MAEEFKPIESQEALDAVIKNRLERNTKTVTEEVTRKYEGYLSPEDVAKAREEDGKKIAELTDKLKGQDTVIADLTAKNKAYELGSTKVRIALESGIPYELADKLSGEDEESIKADALNLSRFVAKGGIPPQRYNPEKPEGDEKTQALKQVLATINKS